ncbi:MAG: putative iron-regulated protein [Bradymonadia bacterium]
MPIAPSSSSIQTTALLVPIALLAACGGRQSVPDVPPVVRELVLDDLEFELRSDSVTLMTSEGTLLDTTQLVAEVAGIDVVYLGEEHDQQSHHDLQSEVINQLAASGNVTVALEMVIRSRQPILDLYSAGRINERRMWNALHWENTWGMDRALYRGVFTSAEEPTVRLLAINIDRGLTQRVFQRGIEELGAFDRQQLPRDYDFSNEAYAAYLESVLAEHMAPDDPDFAGWAERFIEAQLTWDEYMAESIAHDIDAGGDGIWVAVVGSGHVQHRWGIPSRVVRRLEDVTDFTVVCSTVEAEFTDEELVAAVRDRLADPDGDVLCFSLRVAQ